MSTKSKELTRVALELVPYDKSGRAAEAYRVLKTSGVLTVQQIEEVKRMLYPVFEEVSKLRGDVTELQITLKLAEATLGWQGVQIQAIESGLEKERSASRTLSVAYFIEFLISLFVGLLVWQSKSASNEMSLQVNDEQLVITGFQMLPQATGVIAGAITLIVLVTMSYLFYTFSSLKSKPTGYPQPVAVAVAETETLPRITAPLPVVRQNILPNQNKG